MGDFVANPVTVNLVAPSAPFKRADIKVHGLDHSKASFEGRLFFDNPEANISTPTDSENRYAGSFWVFGHGGCAGDEGHCDVPSTRRQFDLRPEHQLTPVSTGIVVTDQLRTVVDPGAIFSLRIVPCVRPEHAQELPQELLSDLLQLDRVDLVAYQ